MLGLRRVRFVDGVRGFGEKKREREGRTLRLRYNCVTVQIVATELRVFDVDLELWNVLRCISHLALPSIAHALAQVIEGYGV